MAQSKLMTVAAAAVITVVVAVAILLTLMPGKTYSYPGVPDGFFPLRTSEEQMSSDRQVLVDLYYAAGGVNWVVRGAGYYYSGKRPDNWLSTEPISSWYGVKVFGGRVTELHLTGRVGLTGNIPPQLGDLTHLTHLNFGVDRYKTGAGRYDYESGKNDLSGSIPTELGNLANLTHLDLSGNKLSGSIPMELGNLTNLTHLNLSGNKLSGSIPAELGNLTNLTHLNLSGNKLSGSIPAELGNLTNLKEMRLSNPGLSGCIPFRLRYIPNSDIPQLAQAMSFCAGPPPTPAVTPVPPPTPQFAATPRPTPTPQFTATSRPTPTLQPMSTPTPQFTATPRPTPTPIREEPPVNFHVSETQVEVSETVDLTLSVTNSIVNPEMTLQFILQLPSGLSVSGGGIDETCSVQCTVTYKVPSGQNRDFALKATPSQPGSFNIGARMEWYFGDDTTTHTRKDASLKLNVLEPVPTPTPPPTPTPTPEPTTPPEAEPSVKLQADKFEVKVGEPVVLNLSAVNTIAKPEMTLQFILQVPSGWSMSGAGLTDACSGQCVATYKLAPGELKSTFLHMLPNQIGSFDAKGRITWYFGDDTQILYGESVSLELTVTESSTLAPPPAPTSTPTPGVAPTVAFAPATPPVNSGGGCGFTSNSKSAGDIALLLALPLLGLAGLRWRGWRRRGP